MDLIEQQVQLSLLMLSS